MNQKYVKVMSFSCCTMISGWPPWQTSPWVHECWDTTFPYNHFSQFAGIGVIGSWYIQRGKLELFKLICCRCFLSIL